MPPSPLDSAATPGKLQMLGEAKLLDPPALTRGLELATSSPPAAEWLRFLSRTLLLLGALLVVSGVVDFFAFNWAKLPPAAKIGGVEALVVLAVLSSLRPASAPVVRQVSLLVASLLVGPLLGVYGQVYQTGADAFELFLGWAALILPWTALAGLPSLWLVFVVVLDLGLVLAVAQMGGGRWHGDGEPLAQALLVFGVHAAATIAYEVLAARGVPAAQARWWPRLLTASGLTALLLPALGFILGADETRFTLPGIILMGFALLGIRVFYLDAKRDLFQLVAGLGCLIALTSTALGRLIVQKMDLNALGMLLVGLAVAGQVGMAARWLRGLGSSNEVDS